jgi:O-acetyl-ADP-ribose deacetylase (regulator of RNase III)
VPIEFIKGDLFCNEELDGLAHGCNCAGVMGKGIAKEFRRRWPRMFEEYRRLCLAGEFTLGDVFVWKDSKPIILNLATQESWKKRADLRAVERAINRMMIIALELGLRSVGLPRIGAGLGGLPWSSVRMLLEGISSSNDRVVLVVYETYKAKSESSGAK